MPLLRLIALTCWAALTASIAAAEEVVLGLSQDRVAITATFDGSEILIFGAVKRESPIATDAPLEVVVTVSGPSEPVMVRRSRLRAELLRRCHLCTVFRGAQRHGRSAP